MKILARSLVRRTACLSAPVALLSIADAVARAVTYAPVSISAAVPSASTAESFPLGLNANDQVVGLATTSTSLTDNVYTFNYSSGSVGTGAVFAQVTQNTTTQYGVAINSTGQIVGGGNYNGANTGFTYNTSGGLASVNATIGATSYPIANLRGLNASGIAVGYVDSTATSNSATRLAVAYNTKTGQMSDVGSGYAGSANGSNASMAFSINDSGAIVGSGPDNIGNTGASKAAPFGLSYFVATPTSGGAYNYTDLSRALNNVVVNGTVSPNTGYRVGYAAIDNLGNVAATYNPNAGSGSGTSQAFIYDAGTADAYQIPISGNTYGATVTGMADVNGTVLVVGDYSPVRGQYSGFVATETDVNGTVTVTEQTLAAFSGLAGATFTDALAVNSNGDIVADGTVNGTAGIYLLVAAPEPTSLLLASSAIVPLLTRRRRPVRRTALMNP